MRRVFLVAALLLGASATAAADEVKEKAGIRYACTGIAESREDPRWAEFPLKLVFATRDRNFLSMVQVVVTDVDRARVFEAFCEFEPWLVVDLPAGEYLVTARALDRQQKTYRVTVPAGGQAQYDFRFDEIVEP